MISRDLAEMHEKYGFAGQTKFWSQEQKEKFLAFRHAFIQEELDELQTAISQNNKEEIVDALIDIAVVALGTLDMFNVDINQAWSEVHVANMSKEPGIKDGRPNPLGLPDLIKPEYWQSPSHKGNTGEL
jgi:predicted HAD superfamily Cof-like phosphohydrolase